MKKIISIIAVAVIMSVPVVSLAHIQGDANNDGTVDHADFVIMSAAFNSHPGDVNWNSDADFNGDGVVDFGDFSIIASNFGQSDPTPVIIPQPAPDQASGCIEWVSPGVHYQCWYETQAMAALLNK